MTAPLMTFALLCYNQEKFVAEAIAAALAQDYSPLEILVSDDASQDGSWSVIQRQTRDYAGPHRLRVIRQPTNLGLAAHIQTLIKLAAGKLIVLAAADDISASDRVTKLAQEFARRPDLACVGSLLRFIDEEGREIPARFGGELGEQALRNTILAGDPFTGASAAYSREIFERFTELPSGLQCEDVVLQFRAALLGDVKVIAEPLVSYRAHPGSLIGGTTHNAVSASAFRQALMTMVQSVSVARQIQIQDLDTAVEIGRISVSEAAALRASLTARKRREEILHSLLARREGAITSWLAATLRGTLPWRDSLKAIAMGLTPSLWFRYIRYRAARDQER